MIKSKNIDIFAIIAIMLAILISLVFIFPKYFNIQELHHEPAYVHKLFDNTYVHRIDIISDDWNYMIDNAMDEEYVLADLVIDNEAFDNVGIRVNGNNSKRLTHEYGSERYSLKIEFDHYNDDTYYGLDKMSLDASFQDNSYLKTWISLDMMKYLGMKTPLFSYVDVYVNGENHGLLLAIEEIEEAFVKRNYGNDHGQLYKPDYKSLNDLNYDIALKYIDDNVESYPNIFDNAKFNPFSEDKKALIDALEIVTNGENLEAAINVESIIKFFILETFVVNLDSYIGHTGHNYFLYEEDGILEMIPWDHNLAFGTYCLGMPNPINDSSLIINYPIDTPNSFKIMSNRPMLHEVMKNDEYFKMYYELYDDFITSYFESGYFDEMIEDTYEMIKEYVAKDRTKFCTYDEFALAKKTIVEFCHLRANSIKGQLEGYVASNWKEREYMDNYIDASHIKIEDMGEISDLY